MSSLYCCCCSRGQSGNGLISAGRETAAVAVAAAIVAAVAVAAIVAAVAAAASDLFRLRKKGHPQEYRRGFEVRGQSVSLMYRDLQDVLVSFAAV